MAVHLDAESEVRVAEEVALLELQIRGVPTCRRTTIGAAGLRSLVLSSLM
jgi:hypothetical protein